ncbi:MAG: hypothetical protein H8E40_15880 [Chloroflexi bacterium]|nr:hypothetical protein [Chloroflexota bacterium]
MSEVLIDPLFYGYALYVLVSRFESITNSTKDYPQYDFWRLLDLDMREDMNFYIVFMIIFILWIFGKSWKHRQELRRDKSVARSLEKIAGVLENMDKKLDDLPVNVRLELEKKDEKPKSKNLKLNL